MKLKFVNFEKYNFKYNHKGIVLGEIPIIGEDKKAEKQYHVGFPAAFEAKEKLKAFVKTYGGNWLPEKRYWYAPVPPVDNFEAFLEAVWEIIVAAISEFGSELETGDETLVYIEVDAHPNVIDDIKEWFKAKQQNIA